MSEIIFLAVLALIVIGPKELPELARTLGRFLNELKRSTDSMGDELKQQMRLDKLDKLNLDTIRNPQQQGQNQNEAEQAPLAPSADAAPIVEEQLEFPQATADEKSEEQKPS
ncbi:twin-arginine translocase TatA/TatE family subunit [Bdellovibrio bacteriovorus]|uniref:Putative sec-independent protein translocase protein n=1 Tax=Bdellovibrio bacteriovorus str. Tiberius TaxID=1069642 RepID=K7Z2R4_BDEBC|nr:twin-arginine translocase TatA/TatE family subunit [Bdellovibrio bacteriovorus]AFY03405.1 putative sec-independent protein translocase protein [Bdellovibrio bacteriovorus str. Tiberius]